MKYKKLILTLAGFISGLATWPFMNYGSHGTEVFYLPGLLFGIFIGLYFLLEYKIKIKNIIAWIFISTLAYAASYFVVLVTALISGMGFFPWIIAGIFGAIIMFLGFHYLLFPIKKRYSIIFYILGALIPLCYIILYNPIHDKNVEYVPLYIGWNAIMAFVFSLAMNSNQVVNIENKSKKFKTADFLMIFGTLFLMLLSFVYFSALNIKREKDSAYFQENLLILNGEVTMLPIDEEWEAIAWARETPSEELGRFSKKFGEYRDFYRYGYGSGPAFDDYSRGLEWSAKFYEEEEYWQVLAYPKIYTDIKFEIHVTPEKEIIYEHWPDAYKVDRQEEFKDIEVITSDIDTSDWEIYRNEELGLEVKYPKGWHYREDGSQFSPFPLVTHNDIGIYVGITSNNIDMSSSDYKEIVLERKQGAQKSATDHLISLYNKDYMQLRIGQRRYTYFIDNNNLWSIGFASGGEFSLDIYNAFLLSFRFID